MHSVQKSILIVFFMLSSALFGQYTDQINSNRPGETMSAFAVGKSVFQLETGVFGITEEHSLLNYDANGAGVDLTLRWGLFKERLELIADLQYQSQKVHAPYREYKRAAMKQTILGAKFLIYDPFKNYKKKVDVYSWKANNSFNWRQIIPAVSLFAGANLTFSENPYHFSPKASISPKIVLITQNHLGNGSWVFVTNIIADYLQTDYPSYGYGITLTKGINKKWSAFVENQGYRSDFYSDAILRGGAAYLISDDMQVDASISTSLKTTPSILYGGVGMSWRFDANYKEVKLDSEKKKKSKKTKKSKK